MEGKYIKCLIQTTSSSTAQTFLLLLHGELSDPGRPDLFP